jgi:hypothetical protein
MEATIFLDATDMAKARTPMEFVAWVKQKGNALSSTVEARAFAKSGAPLAKKFFDELFPLARFVAHEYIGRNDVLIRPNLDNENFDAHVTVGNDRTRQDVFLEVTYAKDGYDLSLRMEVLEREGFVSLTGPVTVSGHKGSPNRRVTVTPLVVDDDDLEPIKKYFSLVEERLRAKSEMQYGNKHILVVAVDDYYVLAQDSHWPLFRAFVVELLPTLALNFPRVVFVGMAGRLFLSVNR